MKKIKISLIIMVITALTAFGNGTFAAGEKLSLQMSNSWGITPGETMDITVRLGESISATSGSIEITTKSGISFVSGSGKWMTGTGLDEFNDAKLIGAFSVTALGSDGKAQPSQFSGNIFSFKVSAAETLSVGTTIKDAVKVSVVCKNSRTETTVINETAALDLNIVEFANDGVIKKDGVWYYVTGGSVAEDFTGFIDYNNNRLRIENGIWNTSYCAVAEEDGGRYYANGKWQKTYTGYANTNGETASLYQYKIADGVLDEDYEGLYKVDGVWRYYRYGKFQATTTGFATDMTRYNAGQGLYRYRIEKGLINFHFTAFAETDNARYYENGRWMNTYTGYANNTQGQSTTYEFYVKNGTIDSNYEGLYKVEGVWRYYRYGRFQATTTGFATDMTRYNAGQGLYRYRIEKGLINFHFTALAETNNKRYYKDGRWMNTFSGTVTIDGETYRIKNGTVIK